MKHLLAENKSIPVNKDDKIEVELYNKLKATDKDADRIIRWYRNAKKRGETDTYLKDTFVRNLNNIKDMTNAYNDDIIALNRLKKINEPIEVNTVKGVKKIKPKVIGGEFKHA